MSNDKSAVQTVKRLFQIGDVLVKVVKSGERATWLDDDTLLVKGRSSHSQTHLDQSLSDH
ncbi:MAG: hypothetical protein L0154_15570 [Chloroflexi bacterium]|nr:hypothetical protein [Chloroflexota bacterium]